MEIVESPQAIITAARSYSSEALEVIAKIMRSSNSEKMRLLAAMALLDRATVPRGMKLTDPLAPPVESRGDMRTRIEQHINANAGTFYGPNALKAALDLKSPISAIQATLVQLQREGVIAGEAGRFTSKSTVVKSA